MVGLFLAPQKPVKRLHNPPPLLFSSDVDCSRALRTDQVRILVAFAATLPPHGPHPQYPIAIQRHAVHIPIGAHDSPLPLVQSSVRPAHAFHVRVALSVLVAQYPHYTPCLEGYTVYRPSSPRRESVLPFVVTQRLALSQIRSDLLRRHIMRIHPQYVIGVGGEEVYASVDSRRPSQIFVLVVRTVRSRPQGSAEGDNFGLGASVRRGDDP
mmetsp:Transcript_29180/g.86390  ORF Transcript_29180/g.86390 Transcript_29180/m.86390 type:complete len:211 (-) Transcript_29180:539-1171(-)